MAITICVLVAVAGAHIQLARIVGVLAHVYKRLETDIGACWHVRQCTLNFETREYTRDGPNCPTTDSDSLGHPVLVDTPTIDACAVGYMYS